MKHIFTTAALLSATLLTGNAAAETIELKGCTKDGLTATLSVEADGKIGFETVKDMAQRAFITSAQNFDSRRYDEIKPSEILLGAIFLDTMAAESDGAIYRNNVGFDIIDETPKIGAPSCQP